MKVLVVGASVRALAQSVRAAGHEPVAVDYFGDRDLRETCEAYALGPDLGLPTRHAAFAVAAARLRARGVAWDAVAYTGSLENAPHVVGRLARTGALLGNPPAALRAVRNWPALASGLAGEGFRVPRSLPAGDRVPLRGRWLLKPLRGAGGAGIRFAEPGEAVPRGRIAQEYVPGTPASALYLAGGGDAVLLAVTEQLAGREALGAPGFAYAGNILLPRVSPSVEGELTRLVRWLARSSGLAGIGGVDLVLTADGPVPIEVNPRYTAAVELLEQATGQSLFPAHLAALEGRLPASRPRWEGYFGKAVVYATEDGVWRLDGDWAAAGLRDVPSGGAPVRRGHPVCTVLAAAGDRETCLTDLVRRVQAVRGELIAPRALARSGPHLSPGRGGQPGQGHGRVPGGDGDG
ncbi:ATP-grasp domain-containing protein [Caldinitratiruptor microaerophilus]|uniref:ATP-dependent carboligase n=1 Tax=Caldinitratiruptor microaerophilus TaxID=671077 RepID=A0AA35G8I3_9FIRM|nr:ATP-grasp domain-containing protein [Caldinitratiruptor microaerophilus]BDG60468.1 ATP-dependent carboligase [Caldinitratiruptor microaerophilus]